MANTGAQAGAHVAQAMGSGVCDGENTRPNPQPVSKQLKKPEERTSFKGEDRLKRLNAIAHALNRHLHLWLESGKGKGKGAAALKIVAELNHNDLFKGGQALKRDSCITRCETIIAEVDALEVLQKVCKVPESAWNNVLIMILDNKLSLKADDAETAREQARQERAKAAPLEEAMETMSARSGAYTVSSFHLCLV